MPSDLTTYVPRCAPLPARPRKVNVTITRTPEGLWRTSMPLEDLDYLIALEFEHHRRLKLAAQRVQRAPGHQLSAKGKSQIKPTVKTKTRKTKP